MQEPFTLVSFFFLFSTISLSAVCFYYRALWKKEQAVADEKLRFYESSQQNLTHTFHSLAAQALQTNNQAFLQTAQSVLERFTESSKVDLTHRQKSISEMVVPIKESLTTLDQKLVMIEKEREGAYQALRQQVTDLIVTQKELRLETGNLVKALRSPQGKGQWGEMQLKRVVEMSGMLSHCDFLEQVCVEGEQGRLRPDMVINLPGSKTIVVDAKAPLGAYLNALEAQTEQGRQEFLEQHAKQVRSHIKSLSQRAYFEQFERSPEFVVLFLPGEVFFSAALEKDPELIEVGIRDKVILATPTTLIALLKSAAYGWRQEEIATNAKKISELGRELYKRLSDMGGHVTKVGKNLNQAVEAYNQCVGTLERRVMVSARKFEELDSSTHPLEEISALDSQTRPLSSIEFNALKVES